MNAQAIYMAVSRRHDLLSHPILSLIQISIVTVGGLFWIQAGLRPEAFDAALYGEFALRFRAEVWAALMMGSAAICWVGLRHPVKRWMVAVGGAIQTAQFLALAYSAIVTGGEPIIGYFCSILFAPLYTWITVEALRHGTSG